MPRLQVRLGIEPALLAQFHPLEESLAALGVAVWPMVELEADGVLTTAAPIDLKKPGLTIRNRFSSSATAAPAR